MTNRAGRILWTTRVLATGLGMALVLSSVTACAATRRNRRRDRSRVLEAENINLRQRMANTNSQMRQAHAEQDAALARAQSVEGQLGVVRAQAQAAEANAHQHAADAATLRQELVGVQNEIIATRRETATLNDRFVRLADQQRAALEAQRSRPVAMPMTPPAPIQQGPSLQAEAMRRDLEDRLRSHGVRDLAVEVRNDFGQERVAIVLPDSFPPGKATLAHNKRAVKAVVGLASLIRADYPDSAVLVEGHTDSDPIRRSNWSGNEALSEARANAVRELLAGAGLQPEQVSTRGYGASRPLDPGNSKAAKSRNRRVEIFITPRG